MRFSLSVSLSFFFIFIFYRLDTVGFFFCSTLFRFHVVLLLRVYSIFFLSMYVFVMSLCLSFGIPLRNEKWYVIWSGCLCISWIISFTKTFFHDSTYTCCVLPTAAKTFSHVHRYVCVFFFFIWWLFCLWFRCNFRKHTCHLVYPVCIQHSTINVSICNTLCYFMLLLKHKCHIFDSIHCIYIHYIHCFENTRFFYHLRGEKNQIEGRYMESGDQPNRWKAGICIVEDGMVHVYVCYVRGKVTSQSGWNAKDSWVVEKVYFYFFYTFNNPSCSTPWAVCFWFHIFFFVFVSVTLVFMYSLVLLV